eukprot:CAMPEP_0201568078 /NCGR_PEP_ID=MMETSP0190_2-20130828/8944_1 /ASSEMBLY_ACC=CAM_ASM_000263 /TAXON_ID=37353 /ORGANISM="Rosalina sp." /LENGTH=230 /DNA_ID=CAMNT_0047988805 /DNA_START=31 /DNA_END=720 /DNA_ORIENTATION=+
MATRSSLTIIIAFILQLHGILALNWQVGKTKNGNVKVYKVGKSYTLQPNTDQIYIQEKTQSGSGYMANFGIYTYTGSGVSNKHQVVKVQRVAVDQDAQAISALGFDVLKKKLEEGSAQIKHGTKWLNKMGSTTQMQSPAYDPSIRKPQKPKNTGETFGLHVDDKTWQENLKRYTKNEKKKPEEFDDKLIMTVQHNNNFQQSMLRTDFAKSQYFDRYDEGEFDDYDDMDTK